MNIEAYDLLEETGTCPRCGGFVDIRFKSCGEGPECPILEDCVGLVVLCPQCDEYDAVEKKSTLQEAIADWHKRTQKYRERGAGWQCSDCRHNGENGCAAHNDFTAPQWDHFDTPGGEWAGEMRCRLFEEKQ